MKRQASSQIRLKGRVGGRLCEMCSTEVAKDWYRWRGTWVCNRCWGQRNRT